MLVTFATKTSKGHERNNTAEKTFACKFKSIEIDRQRSRIILEKIENHNEAKVLWLAHYCMKSGFLSS